MFLISWKIHVYEEQARLLLEHKGEMFWVLSLRGLDDGNILPLFATL